MIGLNIRSHRHLLRNVGETPTMVLISTHNQYFIIGEAIKIKDERNKREVICIFQESFDNNFIASDSKRHLDNKQVKSLFDKYHRCYTVHTNRSMTEENVKMIILPKDFENNYTDFIKNNRKLLEPFIEKYDLNGGNGYMAKYIYTLCDNSPNIFAWALKCFYSSRINMNYIRRILYWNNNYSHLVNKLSKGTIPAYNTHERIFNLLDEMRILRRNKRANDMINIFNTNQKKLLKNIDLNERHYHILGRFGRLSRTKQVNFVRKMSTIENVDELLRQMSFLVDIHFEWNKASLLEYMKNTENLNCDIVIEEETFVLLRANTYEGIKRIAKNTNWCISKNKRYWNDYIERKYGESTQYILCDFTKQEDDKLSIVGFTVTNNRGITSAHNFINDNLLFDNARPLPLKKIVTSLNGIEYILESKNISLNQLISQKEESYEWTRESFLENVKKCVSEENIIIYYDDNNKMVLSILDDDVRYLFNENYQEYISSNDNTSPHFIFADFNRPKQDINKLKFAIIYNNENNGEAISSEVYNENMKACPNTFNSLIEEHGLPYTIIPRSDSNINRFITAISEYDIVNIRKLLGFEDVRSKLMEKDGYHSERIYNCLNWTITNYQSLDILNAIYESGLTLNLILQQKYISFLVYSIFRGTSNGRSHIRPILPNESLLESYYEDSIKCNNTKLSIGFYLALKMIKDNEPFMVLYDKVGKRLSDFPSDELLLEYMNIAIDKLNFNTENELTICFVRMASSFKDKNLFESLYNKNIQNYNVLQNLLGNMGSRSEYYEKFKEQSMILKNQMPRKKKKSLGEVVGEFENSLFSVSSMAVSN